MKVLPFFDRKIRKIIKKLSDIILKVDKMDLRTYQIKIGEKEYKIFSPIEDVYLENIGPEFEPVMVKLYKSLLDKDFYCLDVGANVGCTTILFSDLCRHVDSFEPSRTTFKVLEKNILTTGKKNVSLKNIGLGSSNMVSELAFSSNNRSGGFVANLTSPSSGHIIETIEIKKMDDVYSLNKDYHINFIKIDVEGFEKHVIEGGLGIISKDKPVIVLELNHWCLNAFQRITVPDFFDFLRSIFPLLYAVNYDGTFANLHNKSESYRVMYEHIIHFHFSNLIGAFYDSQLRTFLNTFKKIS
jgi:FkbM family methyltransferase